MEQPADHILLPEVTAAALCERWFGRTGTATRLPGYNDENFLVTEQGGQRWVLKISPPDTPKGLLQLQNGAMLHLEATLQDYTFSLPQPSLEGDTLVSAQMPAGPPRWLRLLSWVAGSPWTDRHPIEDALVRQLGQCLGRLDEALADFDHPAARHETVWDLRRAMDLWPLTPLVGDSRRRAIVEHVLLDMEMEVLPRLATTRRSIIHNDANEHNILLHKKPGAASRAQENSVLGLIDFGDLVLTHTVCEVAIAAAYVLIRSQDLTRLGPLIAGYHQVMALRDEELALLPGLIAGRLVTSVLKSTEGILARPDNAYLTTSQDGAWRALDLLMARQPENLAEQFRLSCGLAAGHDLPAIRPRAILKARRRHLGRNLSLAYQQPLTIVRGSRQYLFDQRGRAYLDLVNNVCHVGHAHPRVVRALRSQAARLNTNTRYLHPLLVDYAERLVSLLPDPLQVVFLCCTGSEANDLALRLARQATGRQDLVVVDAAYHGHTAALIDASPYKFDSAGGNGRAPHIHVVPCPDVYRGKHRGADAGTKYAQDVRATLQQAAQGGGAAAFIVESLLGCGGQIEPPAGYLSRAFEHARQAGALCIADEVQVGFGRVGSHLWGFEAQGAVPDIVTLGKPIGNGHPLAAVVTTAAVADAFDNGMEYFNTFGGNPVSCAVGMAVLDVVRDEALQDNARQVGEHFLTTLRQVADRHPMIGDVRGRGLFLGVELVRDATTLEPAAQEAGQVIEAMKRQGILLSTDGPLHNVLKIKPPLVVDRRDAERFAETLDRSLTALPSP